MPVTNFQPQEQISDSAFDEMIASGFRPISRQKNSRRIREAARLYADVLEGRVEPFLLKQAIKPTDELFVYHLNQKYPGIFGDNFKMQGLREAMSTTDYQALFVDVIDRQYYGWYNDWPIETYPLVKRHTCMDFRVVKRYLYDGMVTPWTAVDSGAPAPMTSLTGPVPQGGSNAQTASTAAVTYQPKAYKAGASITWQAGVNDDLGIFRDVPKRLAIEGNRGTAKLITQFFFDSNGPNASLYTTGSGTYGNIINQANGASTNNPPLDAQGLQDAFTVLMNMKDDTGNPIMVMGNATIYLVHALTEWVTVQNLMNTLTSNISVTGGTQTSATFPAYQLTINNWMKAKVVPIADPYLSIVATAHPHSWALVVDPGSVNRPAVEFGQLRGFETPQIYQRVPNIQRLGGGVEVTMGQYDTLTNDLQIIGVQGGTQIDGRSTVASNASGS